MTDTPLITIGITCYNAQKTIARALHSALQQTWPHIEIIVVDDCSNDDSASIIEPYVCDFENVHLIQHLENKGPAGARNTILHHAKGDIIVFFDDDDEALPHRIETQYARLQKAKDTYKDVPVACFASCIRFYPNGYQMRTHAIGSQKLPPVGEDIADYLLFYKKKSNVFYGAGTPSAALMMETATLKQLGGFDESLRRVEDADLLIRHGLAGGVCVGTDEVLFHQYVTEAADKSADKNLEAEIQMVEKYEPYLSSKSMYAYAYGWPYLRYYYFQKQYMKFLIAYAKIFMRYPVKSFSHIMQTGPKRLRHGFLKSKTSKGNSSTMDYLFAIKTLDHGFGGAERVLTDVTAGLRERGQRVDILTFDQPEGQPFYNLHPDVAHHRLAAGHTEKKTSVLEAIHRIFVLRRFLKQHRPKCVVAFIHSMFVPMTIAAFGTGVPVIASEHIVPNHYETRRFEYMLVLMAAFLAKKITVLSEKIKDQYPSWMHKKMTAIPNAIRPVDRYALKALSHRDNIILNVGRLEEQKAQYILIKAFDILKDKFANWHVRIIGEGSKRGALESLVQQLDLRARVTMPGTTKDIESEYANAKIFAMPSLYESFGMATAEAMAYGLPAVGFVDCPGTNEVIQHDKNGILVDSDDRVKNFADALEKLMLSEELQNTYGRNAQESVQRFHPDAIIAKWEALLKEFN